MCGRRFAKGLACLLLIVIVSCGTPEEPPGIIPAPQQMEMAAGTMDLTGGFTIVTNNDRLQPLQRVIRSDYSMLLQQLWQESTPQFVLDIDTTLHSEAYSLRVGGDIRLTGGSYQAIALALSTLWQSVSDGEVPYMHIRDSPDYSYRSIMLDVARAWHSPETLRTIIDLCRWYKINYLHLHLTDDSAFTFPSDHFPELATANHSYSKAELVALNKYAYDRGVVLVPEIDVPGHASQFIKKMPDLFGISKVEKNPYTINMGKEEVYEALDLLMGEVAAVFTHSPYIHIGGDEAFFDGMEDDPDIHAYRSAHGLPDMHELFLHFLIRMNTIVKSKNKQTIVWSGFGEHSSLQIPNDVIILHWNHIYHDPQDLIAKQYPVINASFKPLYVVNNRKWEPRYIYEQWTPNRWEGWTNEGDFLGVELAPNNQVQGAALCAWEQHQMHQLPRLRHRAASMAQHLWSGVTLPWEAFHRQQERTDNRLTTLIQPFTVTVTGLQYPDLGEGNFNEHLWFGSDLVIATRSTLPDTRLQYATTRTPGDEDWLPMPEMLTLTETTPVHIQAVDAAGVQVGRTYFQQYYYKPLQVTVDGLWKQLPLNSWEKHRFEDTLWIRIETALQDHEIRYETDDKPVTIDSKRYTAPFPVTETTHLRAQLFDGEGKAVGQAWRGSYYKIWTEHSLTTGKPVTASNDHIDPGAAQLAVNGRITLWEMWGDHKSEENWVKVDLEQVKTISRFTVYTFWDNYRYYQYTIEGSLDGESWLELVDNSANQEISTPEGISHTIPPTDVRYLKINLLFNSANPGLHLVEFGAFE